MIPRYHDTTTPRYHDTMIPRHHEAEERSILEEIRKAVKQIGKESATQRLTLEEKQQLRDIEYAYQRLGLNCHNIVGTFGVQV